MRTMDVKAADRYNFAGQATLDTEEARPYFIFRRFSAKEKMERESVEDNQIVFILSGKMKSVSLGSVMREFNAGSALLLPKFSCIFGIALDDCEFIICRIPEDAERYDRFSKLLQYRNFSSDFKYEYNTLTICPVLEKYLQLLKIELSEGMDSPSFQKLKLDELGLCLKTMYPYDVLAEFFYHLIGNQFPSFRKYVLNNYKSYEDVSSFAESAGMSLSTFSRCFKSAFGTTVYKWLDDRKAENIFRDIVMTDMSFAEISEKYCFSAQTYLVYYSKKHFGLAPSAIRKSFSWGL